MKMLGTATSSLPVTTAGVTNSDGDAYTCIGCDHGTNRIPSAFSSLAGSDELKNGAWVDVKAEELPTGHVLPAILVMGENDGKREELYLVQHKIEATSWPGSLRLDRIPK